MKLLKLIPIFLVCAACDNESFARFEIDGVQKYTDCLGEVFPYEPNFLTARRRQESVGLLMQSEGGSFQQSDVVYIEVYDVRAARRGETLTFSEPGTLEAQAIGEIEVAHTCPDLVESMYLTGAVVFDEFSLEQDSFVNGELVDAAVKSRRDEAWIATSLTGGWEIQVLQGQPYEEFYKD